VISPDNISQCGVRELPTIPVPTTASIAWRSVAPPTGNAQLADFIAFFLRPYAEITENLVGPRYADEENRMLDRQDCGTVYRP
jgi:hypothetical protein